MKTRWKVLIGGVLLVFAIGFIVVQQIGQQTAETEIEGMDFTSVKDGQYEGSYSIAIVSATVEVTVQDGKATDKDGKVLSNMVVKLPENDQGWKLFTELFGFATHYPVMKK